MNFIYDTESKLEGIALIRYTHSGDTDPAADLRIRELSRRDVDDRYYREIRSTFPNAG